MTVNYSAMVLAIALIGLGVGLVSLLRHFSISIAGTEWGALLAPMMAYLVFSGSLAEFKAPGFEAKLVARIDAPVPRRIIQTNYVVGGDAPSADVANNAFWGRGQTVIAVLAETWDKMAEGERVTKGLQVAVSVYQSLLAGGFLGIVVLDVKQRPLGFFEASYFLDVLRVPLDRSAVPSEFEKDVLTPAQIRARFFETQLWSLLRFPRQRVESEANKAFVAYDIPRKDALKKMVEENLEVLVVCDAGDRYMGVLSRRKLVDQLLLDLVEASKLR
jgi:CBS domain-containing protein